MPNKVCNAIQDTETGLWLTGYAEPVAYCTWGNEENAVCFTSETKRQEVLAALNDGTSRFIGSNPKPR